MDSCDSDKITFALLSQPFNSSNRRQPILTGIAKDYEDHETTHSTNCC
jgi:hypothetical protein